MNRNVSITPPVDAQQNPAVVTDMREMNGAEGLVRTLVANGVDVCFANPGTSEMHFVAALDKVPEMRCVLGLFEGVVTGAADGYGRMTGKPAATLLHLGPGLANGLANLHNARRAQSPILNIVGDHATYHREFDSPLTSDIEMTARPFSHWVRTSPEAGGIAEDAVEAIAAARSAPGHISTLILPADTAWTMGGQVIAGRPQAETPLVSEEAMADTAARLGRGTKTGLLVAGRALQADALELAGRIAAATGAAVMSSNLVARQERGAGRFSPEIIPYAVDAAVRFLADFRQIIVVGAPGAPVAFFAYPGLPSRLAPRDCEIATLATPGQDIMDALQRLAERVGATAGGHLEPLDIPSPATGALTAASIGQSLGAFMPEGAIVVDEAVSSGAPLFPATRTSRPHDWMKNMGGSIGFGLPAAAGAAIACPDRKVICLEADGSAMYTQQALWTYAREELDILVVIFNNRKYEILRGELAKVQAGVPGINATNMLEIGRPDINWTLLARGQGVEAVRVEDMKAFNHQYSAAIRRKGPFLIEVMI